VLLVFKENSIFFFKAYGYANIFSKRKMTTDTLFDLASLTKPLATTLAVMRLIEKGRLDLEQNLETVLPQFKKTGKREIKIKHLLRHNSGLPDYRPFYIELGRLPFDIRKNKLKSLLVEEPLLHPIGKKVVYSDIGFMILNWVVKSVSGERLDHFVTEEIYRPLGLENLFFPGLGPKSCEKKFAATEFCSWRNILLDGVVHDENAYVLGGIEGHAGLFGTADDVNVLLTELMSAFRNGSSCNLFKKDLVRSFLMLYEDTERTLGFDTPSLVEPSCGHYFSRRSVGHLGFTGTSFWIDLERYIGVILLTNRIHPSRDNTKVKAFRPQLHNAVMENVMR